MAAVSMSAPTIPLRCGLIACVPTIRAALLRSTSHFRAHCPVFWPQMAHERKFKARRLTWQLLLCQVRRGLHCRRLACHQARTGGHIAAVCDARESVLAVFVCRGL